MGIHIPGVTEEQGYPVTQLLFDEGMRIVNADGDPRDWVRLLHDFAAGGEEVLEFWDPAFQERCYLTRAALPHIVAICRAFIKNHRDPRTRDMAATGGIIPVHRPPIAVARG